MKKVISIVIVMVMVICVFSTNTLAKDFSPDSYVPSGMTDTTEFIDYIGIVLGALRILGSFVCVVTLIILGIRYMIGSASDKATYKETMVPYLIGAVMVFAIPTILQVMYELVKGNIYI